MRAVSSATNKSHKAFKNQDSSTADLKCPPSHICQCNCIGRCVPGARASQTARVHLSTTVDCHRWCFLCKCAQVHHCAHQLDFVCIMLIHPATKQRATHTHHVVLHGPKPKSKLSTSTSHHSDRSLYRLSSRAACVPRSAVLPSHLFIDAARVQPSHATITSAWPRLAKYLAVQCQRLLPELHRVTLPSTASLTS